ncbi:MAG: hypothetical protein DMF73_20485 [Acidobacteria bacterium]|nr:MAG: hypothetical protein DMF73_20485 [Acidobacteriota bacterium]
MAMKFNKLILKNILRNKRRTLLTISSLVVSLFLMITLATILTELTRSSDKSNPLRLVTRHAVSLGFTLPVSQRQRIATVPGVKNVMTFSWFGGIYKEPKNFFANFAVDADRLREILTELNMSDAEWQAFINDKQGAIVGAKLVKLHGFTPGQRITLKSPIYNNSVEFVIRGVCTGGDEKTLFFHYDYLSDLLPAWAKDQVSTFSILANSAEDVPRIAQTVDSIFLNTDAPTKTESERDFAISFQTMYGGVKQFMYGIIAAITFSLLLVGMLKALGFQRGTIARLFVSEALLVSIVGGVIGIAGTLLLFKSFDLSVYIPNLPSFAPTPATLVAAVVVSLVVGLASVVYSAYRVSGMTIAEALRSTE